MGPGRGSRSRLAYSCSGGRGRLGDVCSRVSFTRRNGIKFDARWNRRDPGDAGCVAEIRRTAILGTSCLEFLSHERARVDRGGKLDWIFGAIGSRLTKNFSELDLAGEGAQGRMSGFYFTDGNQHLDHDTQQNHLAPHTTSDLLFKGALKGKSRSVWQGMIYVAPGAQKTDGYQANRNLVLSDGRGQIPFPAGNPGGRCALHTWRNRWQVGAGAVVLSEVAWYSTSRG